VPVPNPFRTADLQGRVALAVMALLALAPPVVFWIEEPFYIDILTRLMILAVAAASLNLVLGYGGMISFGHAACLGIGAYAAGILSYYDVYNGYVQLAVAVGATALFAFLTGLVCLRTRGVYFIMITLAFAQMAFYAFVSIEEYGGDDGLVIYRRSRMGGLLDLENDLVLYYLAFFVLAATLYFVHRFVRSRFGMVIRGSKGNDARLQSLGFNTFRYRLTCYVIAGVICGLAGWLLANFSSFISPATMAWTRSGELIFMVVLGGAGTVVGPLLGTGAFVIIEEYLSGFTIYWELIFGILLICMVLFARGGIAGLFSRLERRRD
jgi:branched-chain amino acid transport system permease protein